MATFSKRHYQAIAAIINKRAQQCDNMLAGEVASGYRGALVHVQHDLSRIFTADNPKFNADRFNKACEPGEKK